MELFNASIPSLLSAEPISGAFTTEPSPTAEPATAERANAKRASTERATAEQPPEAEHVTADPAAGERATATRATADPTTRGGGQEMGKKTVSVDAGAAVREATPGLTETEQEPRTHK